MAKIFVKAAIFILLGLAFNLQWAVTPGIGVPLNNASGISDQQPLYRVKIEYGRRRTISGKKRSYTLYAPQTSPDLPGGPFPIVVMIHGFLMSGTQQSKNAEYLAERGLVVLLPNLTRVLWGDKNRVRNIKDIIDQIGWLKRQEKTPKSPFYGLIDFSRLAIAGNSSGGAVCLELLIQAQKEKIPVQTMCSMEGVPWDRSLSNVPKLQPTHILALRAEPSICNEHDNMLRVLNLLKFSFDDVKINGAQHCDAENPTTLRCMCICGRSREKYRLMFQRLLYLYCRDTLGAPRLDGTKESFTEVVQALQKDGKVIAELNHLKCQSLSSGREKHED